jgi:hypothetical protein
MAYESCVLDGLFAVRWGAEPELGDVAKYVAELAAARARQATPLVAMFIMPPDSKNPSDAFRKIQADALPAIMENVDFCVALFEGSGFKIALKRTALGAILLLAPKRFAIHVRETAEEALIYDPPQPIRFDAKRAIAELRRRGILA